MCRQKEGPKQTRAGGLEEGPLGRMRESENAIDGSEDAARDDRRMTAWLWD